jgi:maltose alpha-D-glucosyltransferase/alpha-amylase
MAPQPEWYRDAVVYQLHVRAFQDSDDNGIGDFDGLATRLDYLQDLGVTALWLLPFYPSPLRDDGYDIADYRNVHPDYGSMRSFRRFLREAHRRDLHVITELVLNHTSDQHPWFRRARRARPGTPERDYYVWSDTTDRYRDARVIFRDFESSNWSFDEVASQYYWHRFYSHQPDLNFENPAVHAAMRDIFDFWLREGVDGFRLDAVPYLYEAEGTNCENLPATHEFLRQLRRHIDDTAPNRMLVAEANQWPEDAVAYFGNGDECHLAFNFPIMPRLFMAVRMEDRFPLVEILEQTPPIPDGCQWAIFLRNHDELTLEMVTDEERDYMYRVYASDPQMRVNLGIRRRLAPLLQNDRRRIELLNGLLFSLPGTPVVYYGDEIGMGDNVWLGDRNSMRTPMQWNADRNAGFSRANPQSLYLPVVIDPAYHYELINVEAQLGQPASLLRWMRQMIALRTRYRVFGRGSLRMLAPGNSHVVAFVREDADTSVLVVANLSRRAQAAEVELTPWVGLTPFELLGGTEFPSIGTLPYLFTLDPYGFHMFELRLQRTEAPVVSAPPQDALPVLTVRKGETLARGRPRAALARLLSGYLSSKRWFAGKARGIESVRVADVMPAPGGSRDEPAFIVLADVELRDGSVSTYVLPLAVARGRWAEQLLKELAHGVIACLDDGHDETSALYEALWSTSVAAGLLDLFRRRGVLRGERGVLEVVAGPSLRQLLRTEGPFDPRVLRAEQSNTSVAYGHALLLKLFRHLEPGPNPEAELGERLDGRFQHAAPFGGSLRYRPRSGEPSTVAVLSGFVPHETDGWHHTVASFKRAFEELPLDATLDAFPEATLIDRSELAVSGAVAESLGTVLPDATLLGQRTAELHAALATPTEDPSFSPERFSPFERRALYQSFRSTARRSFQSLRAARHRLRDEAAVVVDAVLALEDDVLERYATLLEQPLHSIRIRTHGDYHLGQVLYTGRDFVIVDFEGEPARSLGERRRKLSPLRDVAGIVRSYDYAAFTAVHDELLKEGAPERATRLDAIGAAWSAWSAATFVRGYREAAAAKDLLPEDRAEEELLLELFTLDKAVYEVRYELGSRPDWVWLPLSGILRLLRARP